MTSYDPYLLETMMSQLPFLRQVREYVRSLGLQLSDFADPSMSRFTEAAARRVEEALIYGVRQPSGRGLQPSEEEVISYPLAMALVAMLSSPKAVRRFAASEAERYGRILSTIAGERIRDVLLYLAGEVLGVEAQAEKPPYEFRVAVPHYLRLAVGLNEPRWKLVNRMVHRGYVYVTRPEMITLVKNGLEHHIRRRLEEMGRVDVPQFLEPYVERLKKILEKMEWRRTGPLSRLGPESWPPCMQALRARLLAGEPVSHFGNFSAASFMLRIGMTVEEVVEMYSQRGDFDPRIARYQVEHIAGLKGSRTRYSVPRCSTMQTHGLCIENGRLCGGVRSPMEYYRRMAAAKGGRNIDRKASQESG